MTAVDLTRPEALYARRLAINEMRRLRNDYGPVGTFDDAMLERLNLLVSFHDKVTEAFS